MEFLFNLRKELPRVTLSRILKWAIKIMEFDFEIIYVKRNTIPHVDALSRIRFHSENSEDRIIQWVEMDILPHKTPSRGTQRDPILSRILECIRKNVWSYCTIAERPFKESRQKLTVERGVVFSADAIMPAKILRKDVIKSVHDDIHGGVVATQRKLRLLAWWPGYCKDVEEHIR